MLGGVPLWTNVWWEEVSEEIANAKVSVNSE